MCPGESVEPGEGPHGLAGSLVFDAQGQDRGNQHEVACGCLGGRITWFDREREWFSQYRRCEDSAEPCGAATSAGTIGIELTNVRNYSMIEEPVPVRFGNSPDGAFVEFRPRAKVFHSCRPDAIATPFCALKLDKHATIAGLAPIQAAVVVACC